MFWIERPSVSLSGVRGLDTIVGGRYVTLLPGPDNNSSQLVFKGLPEAPPILERSEGGLEIILEAQERNGLQPSSPVTYRGISVGYITSVGLASDAGLVEARAYIKPTFRHLVREDSMFWAISGVEVELGFTGVKMNMESLQTITAGGVAFRTPKSNSANATTGKRFDLATEVEPTWLEWEPQLAVGSHLLPGGLTLPSPARASLNWSERNYVGLLRDRQRDGWILPLSNSKLISLSEMLSPVEGAHEGKTTLAVEGQELTITEDNSVSKSGISIFTLHSSQSIFTNLWPSARLRGPQEPEDCILWISASEPALPIAQGRMEKHTPEAEGSTPYWQFKQELSFEDSWNGASVISRNDGKLIGFWHLSEGNPKIIPLPEKLFSKS